MTKTTEWTDPAPWLWAGERYEDADPAGQDFDFSPTYEPRDREQYATENAPKWVCGPLPTRDFAVILPKYSSAPSYNQAPLTLREGRWYFQNRSDGPNEEWLSRIEHYMLLERGML